MRSYRSLREGVTADVGFAIAMATGGAALLVPVEYALALWTYTGETELLSKLRLVPLVITLALFLWLVLVVGLVAIAAGTRLVRARFEPPRATAPSILEPAAVVDGVRPGVPRVWAAIVGGVVFALAISRVVAWALEQYKQQQLIALLVGVLAIPVGLFLLEVHRVLVLGAEVAAAAFAPWLGRCNPLGRWRACGVALAVVVGGGLAAAYYLVPATRSYLQIRLVASAVVVTLGMGLGLRYLPRRWPRRDRRSARRFAAAAFVIIYVSLVRWGADHETRYLATTGSPALDRLVGFVRVLNDVDFDGYGSVLGGNDCKPFDAKIHPGDATDLPDDGIDQNCDGIDFTLASLVVPTGPTLPIPKAFDRDWNFLFLTVDAVRYDRTSFGGYKTGPKQRDTTPNLEKLVAKSTSFVYAQSPSAGTMASIPAILTSKFFHSGIALDEKRPAGTPPGILPENVLLPEILKKAGYRTGIIGSHEWWTGWGIDQGVDPGDFDNSLGEKPDSRRVVADKITDHALQWISRQQGKKWFLWAHYIDPHGVYIKHPEVADYGNADPDLYDSEIKWTDQEIGRLLDELVTLPSYSKTIVIITADHGENMGEHNGTVGTHGNTLYREQLHVPLIVFVPGGKPQQIRGAVTNLDVVPTIAALAHAEVDDLAFEGRSLVPQIFYGKEDRDRIVFAETNAPGKQRAAISERWKLIYYLSSNLHELFDSSSDPGERLNLAPKSPPELAMMRTALEQWMSRVMYARDPLFNQAYRQMRDVVLDAAPTPQVTSTGYMLDGSIEILGIGHADGKPWGPGARSDIHVFFKASGPGAAPYRFALVLWPAAPGTALTAPTTTGLVRGPARATADGAYPADKWKSGDFIRDRFPFNVPADWKTGVAVGLLVTNTNTGERIKATGPSPSNDPFIHSLGVLPLGSSPPPSP